MTGHGSGAARDRLRGMAGTGLGSDQTGAPPTQSGADSGADTGLDASEIGPAQLDSDNAFGDILERHRARFIVIDADGTVRALNHGFLDLFGLPEDFARIGEAYGSLAQRASLRGESALIALGTQSAEPGYGTGRGKGQSSQPLTLTTAAGRTLCAINEAMPSGGGVITVLELTAFDLGAGEQRPDGLAADQAIDQGLRESAARLRHLVKLSSDWSWAMDDDFRFILVSEHVKDITGMKADEMIGGTCGKIALRTDISDDPEIWRGLDENLRNQRAFRGFKFRVASAGGGVTHLNISGAPVFDSDGTFRGYHGTGTNITHEVKADARAANAQARLVEAIEGTSEGFGLFDRGARLVLSNTRYRELWPEIADMMEPGICFEDLLRAGVERNQNQEWRLDPKTYIAECLARHRNPPSMAEHKLPSSRWHQISERRTADGVVVLVFTKITGIKKREEGLRLSEKVALEAKEAAELANRSKLEFLANMSHELRTPLNAIIGFSEIMKEQLFGPIGSDHYLNYINDVHASGLHLLEVISDILDMSKVEAGKLELTKERADIEEAIRASARIARERANSGGVALLTTIEQGLPPLKADGRKLKQILINLLGNAVKFTPEGGSVSVEACLTPTEMVIRVSDTGIGIAPGKIEKVLQAFGQVESAMSRKYDGTGLGLSLPIRLSPTPTICSVSPWTAGKGRRRRIEEAIRLILDCSENRTGV